MGLDLGEKHDPSAIAVVEQIEERGRAYQSCRSCEELQVRYVGRVPLGTPYPLVVGAVRETVQHQELRGRCSLVVDSTGVGVPVVEMLRSAQLGCEVTAVTITSGERASQHGMNWNVPKVDLMAGLQLLLEQGQLRIAQDLPEAGWLVKELVDVRVKRRESGRVRMGADGCGEHDDLVIALALACWRARSRKTNGLGGGRLF